MCVCGEEEVDLTTKGGGGIVKTSQKIPNRIVELLHSSIDSRYTIQRT